MSYKFEMHCHTAETSYCATSRAEDSVILLKNAGYDGVVITNHYYGNWFDTCINERTWEEKMNAWLKGYRLAKIKGDELGLTVILGVEFTFDYNSHHHFLSYGMDESFFFEYPELYRMTPDEYFKLANEKGLYFGQAHPIRDRISKAENPLILHGMEIFNSLHENFNDEVYDLIKENKLIATAGSDYHCAKQACKTAMLFPELPKDSKEVARLLLNNKIDGYVLNTSNIPDVFKNDPKFICNEIVE